MALVRSRIAHKTQARFAWSQIYAVAAIEVALGTPETNWPLFIALDMSSPVFPNGLFSMDQRKPFASPTCKLDSQFWLLKPTAFVAVLGLHGQ